MATKNITARIPTEIFNRIKGIAEENSMTRTDVILHYLKKGLSGELDKERTTYQAAQGVTEDIMQYKSRIQDLENALKKSRSEAGKPAITHPLLNEIENDGIKLVNNEGEYVINSLPDLLSFIQKKLV